MRMHPAIARALVEEREAEINNGGFDQFFFNNAGNQTAESIEALKAIGAIRTASIVAAAAGKFPGSDPPIDRTARQGLLLETVSPGANAFSEQDDAFLAYEDDLAALLEAYAG